MSASEQATEGRHGLRVGSTFSGVGGADLGLERAGFQLAWTCEWDEWKRSVLAAHWPGVHHYSDIRDVFDPESVDMLVGGFPCQDLSVAGKRRGFDGERSVLAFEFLRIAESIRPRWLLMENVPGLLSSNGGRDLARLLDELGACGYGWAYRILDARYFGVPQRRRRVFICARRADPELDSRAAAGLALRALWEGSGGDSTPGWPPRAFASAGVGGGARGGSSVGGVMGDVSHTLTGEGHDASEDGTGRGTPIVGVNGDTREAISNAVTRKWAKGTGGPAGDECQNLVTQHVAATLTSGGHPNSNAPGRRNEDDVNLVAQPTAFRKSKRAASDQDDETWVADGAANTLNAFDAGDTRTTHAVVEPISFYPTGGSHTPFWSTTGVTPTIKVGSNVGASNGIAIAGALDRQAGGPEDNSAQAGHLVPHVASTLQGSSKGSRGWRNDAEGMAGGHILPEQMSVRRLTPVECERLMGWPDDWTAPPGVKAPDSKRYAACGDGIVSWVAYWIGCRIRMIEDESR